MAKKKALITGAAGQDGTYLSELLLEQNYTVLGTVRSLEGLEKRLPPGLFSRVKYLPASAPTQGAADQLIQEVKPDEVYHLAGLSFVPATATEPAIAAEEIAMSSVRLLQAIRNHAPHAKYYQSCSSEMFGSTGTYPQNEETPLAPKSPYGAAKAYAYFSTKQFRELFGMYAVAGISYNHESPRRPPQFVSRRITQSAAQIKLGLTRTLKLGDVEAQRDWGYSRDYVRAMWMMLQQPKPQDYVIATGVLRSVRQMLEVAFDAVGLDWKRHVEVDRELVRPQESRPLVGDITKIRAGLGWEPQVSFEDLIRMMVHEDLKQLQS